LKGSCRWACRLAARRQHRIGTADWIDRTTRRSASSKAGAPGYHVRTTWTTFAAFLIAVALGAMVPGSTTALVIRQSAVHGARAAVPLVMGVEVGLYAWIIASALGVAAVVGASETAYTVLRIVGAAVLILLGI
jgi:LysE type translocator